MAEVNDSDALKKAVSDARNAGALRDRDWFADECVRLRATLAAVEKDRDEALARLTYWYEPDGTVTTHDPEKVKSMRIAAAKQIADLRITLAASQATVKELREALAALHKFRVAKPLSLPEHEVAAIGRMVGQALARTDDMGALEALLGEAVKAGAGARVENMCKLDDDDVAAIVARLMRRAGETK